MKLRTFLLRGQILVIALPIFVLSMLMFQFLSRNLQQEIYH